MGPEAFTSISSLASSAARKLFALLRHSFLLIARCEHPSDNPTGACQENVLWNFMFFRLQALATEHRA